MTRDEADQAAQMLVDGLPGAIPLDGEGWDTWTATEFSRLQAALILAGRDGARDDVEPVVSGLVAIDFGREKAVGVKMAICQWLDTNLPANALAARDQVNASWSGLRPAPGMEVMFNKTWALMVARTKDLYKQASKTAAGVTRASKTVGDTAAEAAGGAGGGLSVALRDVTEAVTPDATTGFLAGIGAVLAGLVFWKFKR